MSQQAIIDLQRFKRRAEAALAQATTPMDRLVYTVLIVAADSELRAGRDGSGVPSRPGIGTPAPRPIAPGRNGRTL